MGYGKPAWLDALYTQKFFVNCSFHDTAKKNVLCLDCCVSLYPHCISTHGFLRLLQIRRHVYHDVIRLQDLDKLIDSSNVQAYTINSAKVIFIKKIPQNRLFKGAANYCTSCDRSLQESYIHCSLGCKVEFVLTHNRDLTPYLRVCIVLKLSPDYLFPQEQDMGDETPNSTIVDCEDPMSMSSYCVCDSSDSDNTSVAATEIVRNKRSGLYAVCGRSSNQEDMATIISRRKGIPPLC